MPAEACNRVKPGLNKTVLYHVSNFLDSRNRQNLQTPTQQSSLWSQLRMKRAVKSSLGFYFLGGTPCLVNSRSARSPMLACSPKASLRIRSWQGSQIAPLSIVAGLPQIMHVFFSSLISLHFI